uniref:Uncharacterized protein n=1 Tax=Triticum urartu TaxID=4572 RepID=A0A8R7VBF3_TRIUA
MRKSDLRCRDSFDLLSTLGFLDTARATSASDHLNVFFKYSTLAVIFSWVRKATACSAYLNIPEPGGIPSLWAHATIARTCSGLVVRILSAGMHSLTISQAPSPHSCRKATLGLTTLSRLQRRRQLLRLSGRSKLSMEPKRGR